MRQKEQDDQQIKAGQIAADNGGINSYFNNVGAGQRGQRGKGHQQKRQNCSAAEGDDIGKEPAKNFRVNGGSVVNSL